MIFYKSLLALLLGTSAYIGIISAIKMVEYISGMIGETWAIVALCPIGLLLIMVHRRIKPKTSQVWEFKFPIYSFEVIICVVWFYLTTYTAMVVFMAIQIVAIPFLLIHNSLLK